MDKLPPSSFESEQAVIGCCLFDPQHCIPESQIALTSEHFYDLRCRLVWDALSAMPLFEVNLISVMQRLRDRNELDQIGGVGFLTDCENSAPSTANLPVWIAELVEKFTLRKTIQVCRDFMDRAHDVPAEPALFLDELEKSVLSIRPNVRSESNMKALIQQAIEKIEYRCKNPHSISGLSTGLPDLDRLTDGCHAGEMVVVCGFPSTGKTALAVNIAVHNGLEGVPAAIFSAEMPPVSLVVRSMCSESRQNFKALKEENLKPMVVAAGRLVNSPIHIERANGMTVGQVCAVARRLKQRHNIRLIVIDYIQLLNGTGDNREQQVSSVAKGIKAMALELDVCVLALSQLTDDGKLRESRAIGQEADSIWKLVNDGAWQPKVQPVDLMVEKCRDGETGLVKLVFQKTITRFESVSRIDDSDIPQPKQPHND